MINHQERAHSKFSASGSERWLKCAASVELEEKSPPSPDTPWSKEGTLAHEVLECILTRKPLPDSFDVTQEMIRHCERAANKILALKKAFGGTLLIEKKVFASFIHPEMFGTCDAILADDSRTLHVIDFKYGAGHVVDAKENTQLIQYALSAAESYDWDFDEVKMWIMQPRVGHDWHKSWTITMNELKTKWLPLWHTGVKRVLSGKSKPFAGSHCHWCRAKSICPEKTEVRAQKVISMFENNPIEGTKENGVTKESRKKEVDQKGKARGEKSARQETNTGAKCEGKTQSKNGKAKRKFKGEAESFGISDGADNGSDSFF